MNNELKMNAVLAALKSNISALKKIINTNSDIVQTMIRARFEGNNGCTLCYGTGRVEYGFSDDRWNGPCNRPECTPESRKASGELTTTARVNHPMYRQLNASLEQTVEVANLCYSELEKFQKGDTVIVVKGRKVPKGIVGKVFWVGQAPDQSWYGQRYHSHREINYVVRLGFKDEQGTVYWINSSNVDRVLCDRDQEWLAHLKRHGMEF